MRSMVEEDMDGTFAWDDYYHQNQHWAIDGSFQLIFRNRRMNSGMLGGGAKGRPEVVAKEGNHELAYEHAYRSSSARGGRDAESGIFQSLSSELGARRPY